MCELKSKSTELQTAASGMLNANGRSEGNHIMKQMNGNSDIVARLSGSFSVNGSRSAVFFFKTLFLLQVRGVALVLGSGQQTGREKIVSN